MIPISVNNDIKLCVPLLSLCCIESDVTIENENPELWDIIEKKTAELFSSLKTEDISKLPAIASSRNAYKLCGKDPARYRLSAEALLRRITKGNKLYRINNVVDIINLVSLSTGFSIGGYDTEKILEEISFGIGKKNEPYEAVGRGLLNIESLPVFRDKLGAFGSPTSDSVRTSVTPDTKRFLMIIINFGVEDKLKEASELAVYLLKQYANAKNIVIRNIK